jgi:hypothetical protein
MRGLAITGMLAKQLGYPDATVSLFRVDYHQFSKFLNGYI